MHIIFYFYVIQIDLSDFPIWFNFFEKCFINFTSFRIFLFWFVLITEKGIREITNHCLLFEKCLQIQTSKLTLNFSVSAYLSIYNLCRKYTCWDHNYLTWWWLWRWWGRRNDNRRLFNIQIERGTILKKYMTIVNSNMTC